jgi:hypothetical protein
MSQSERLSVSLGYQERQPPPLAHAKCGTHSRLDWTARQVYTPDPYYIVDEEESYRPMHFDDSSLKRSMRTPGPTFMADINFSEFPKRIYINYLRVVYPSLLELLEGASPDGVVVNTPYRNFQRNMFRYLCAAMKHPTSATSLSNF